MFGFGLLVSNDTFGDGHDRWRSGSFASSYVWAPDLGAGLPASPGEVIEFRFNGEILAPENISRPAPRDRRYAQALSFGLHTHFRRRAMEYAVGADLVVTGPVTQLDHLQKAFHSVLGGRTLSPAVKAAQISNDVDPTLVIEAGREFPFGARMRLRPFIEVRWGIETLLRAGGEVTLGRFGQGGLLVRAPDTGQRFSAVQEAPYRGFSLVLGGDVAHVINSDFFPSTGPVRLRETRARARLGLHWRNRKGTSLFYGLNWLGKEFEGQREGQFAGSLQLRLKF